MCWSTSWLTNPYQPQDWSIIPYHWNWNVIILKVVILTSFGAASDESWVKMTLPFLCTLKETMLHFWHKGSLPLHLFHNLFSGGRFKNTNELLNLRALKFSSVNKIQLFQCMGKIFCVEFQRYPLKFHTKYLTHTLKDTIFIQHWNFKSS